MSENSMQASVSAAIDRCYETSDELDKRAAMAFDKGGFLCGEKLHEQANDIRASALEIIRVWAMNGFPVDPPAVDILGVKRVALTDEETERLITKPITCRTVPNWDMR